METKTELFLKNMKKVISEADPDANKEYQNLLIEKKTEKSSSNNPYAWQINEIIMDIECSETNRPWLMDLARVISDRYECQYYLYTVSEKSFITFIGLLYDPVKCVIVMLDAFRNIRDVSERYYDRNQTDEGDCLGYGFVFGFILENGTEGEIMNSVSAFIYDLNQNNKYTKALMRGYSIGTLYTIRDDLLEF